MESWITFSCFGDWESPVLVSEGDDVLLRATRRLLCLADPSRSVGGNTLLAGEQQVSIKKSRIALDSDQISGEMMRKPRRSSSSSATYWNGEEPGRLSWPGGRRRRGRTPLPRGRRRRPALSEPCLPCAVALGRTPPARPAPISYPQAAGKERTLPSRACARPPGLCRSTAPTDTDAGTRTEHSEKNIARARLIWIRRRRSGASQTRRRAASEPVFSAAHGLFCVLLLPAHRLAPAARARQLALLRCSPAGSCAVGGERRPVAAGASRRGC